MISALIDEGTAVVTAVVAGITLTLRGASSMNLVVTPRGAAVAIAF